MTQIPQPPYAPPPFAPGAGYGMPAPKQSNVAAIVSLICGIVGCLFITPLLAIIFGIVGIAKAPKPAVGGKGLAITGLILGLVWLIVYGLFGGVFYGAYALSKPARNVAHQFATDLSTGNVNAAAAATAGISVEELTTVSEKMKPWGALQDVTLPAFNYHTDAALGTVCELTGIATFATGGQKAYTITLVKQNGLFKVQKFNFQ